MNEVLDDVWVERIERLALGLVPHDAITSTRVREGLHVRIERAAGPEPLPRHATNAFAAWLTLLPGDEVDVLAADGERWYVPRRLRIQLTTDPSTSAAERTLEPLLHPGAGHPLPARATGIRGRVTRDGEPMRWARVELLDPRTGRRLVTAHGDDRGDFVAVLGPSANGAVPPGPIPVRVRVHGPAVAPPFDPEDVLADLPVEIVPVPGRAPDVGVASGAVPPPGYVPTTTGDVDVDLPLGVMRSADLDPFPFAS